MAEGIRNYDALANTYEFVSNIYSTGQIKAAKVSQLDWLSPGASILYLGCGCGEDVLAASQRNFRVSAIDVSSKMLKRLEEKLVERGLEAELICKDMFEFEPPEKFDAVAANFFLNIFSREAVEKVVDHAISLVKPGGLILVSDVSLPTGWLPSRCFNWCYVNVAQLSAAMAGLVSLHRNHDYHELFSKRGLEISDSKHFRFCGRGPVLFQSIKVELVPNSKLPWDAQNRNFETESA